MTRPKPLAGIAAKFASICGRCSRDIARGDRVVFKRGAAIHVECANGQDDE